MATWIGSYVKDRPPDRVAELCEAWLQRERTLWVGLLRGRVRRRLVPARDAGGFWMGPILLPSRPTRALVYAGSDGWTNVLTDSFADPNPLAGALSEVSAEPVVHTVGQTTSDAYSVRVFRGGACVRHLAFAADEGWMGNDGPPLPGEPAPLETAPETEEDEAWFDAQAMERYLRSVFGIQWWSGPTDIVWVVE